MSEEMQQDAVDYAGTAIENFEIKQDIAKYITQQFNRVYSPTWNCIVGEKYGSYVTHETNHFIYFHMGKYAFLLFKPNYNDDVPKSIKGNTTESEIDTRKISSLIIHDSELKICSICMEKGQTDRDLACGHSFHISCLETGLQNQRNCPNCRSPIK